MVLIIFTILYSFILLTITYGINCNKTKIKHTEPRWFIYVIIACKNEESQIERLINSLINQSYNNDMYKVIFSDDGSTDSTAEIIKQKIRNHKNFHYIYVDEKTLPDIVGKKKAITHAIETQCNISSNNILAFTDSDCEPDTGWLHDINNAFNNGCDFYAGYSPIVNKTSASPPSPIKLIIQHIIYKLKNIERASIFAISSGSFGLSVPLTCTARNMAYKSTLWQQTEGFSNISHIRSGDDDLMLLKMRKMIKNYHFSFNDKAFVNTYENKNIRTMIDQETRRTSKLKYYPNYIKLLLVFVTIYYLILIYGIIISLLTNCFNIYIIYSLIAKLLAEFTLLSIFLIKVKNYRIMKYFLLAELIYIPYFLFFGIKGSLGKYRWKK